MAKAYYPYTQTVVKFSYKNYTKDSRFEHSELDTATYAITWQVPADKGYVYNDFGYERVQEIKSKYQYQFELQTQQLISKVHQELEDKLKSIRHQLESEMAQELLVGVVPSKSVKEAA